MIIRKPKEEEFKELYLQRWKVLREPFGLPRGSEKDEFESISCFVIAMDTKSNKIIGSGRLVIHNHNEGKIKDIAVNKEYRNRHIATKIMRFLHNVAKKKGIKKLTLDSRENVEGFYEKMGYKKRGDYFTIPPTNIEHIKMVIYL